MSILFYLIPLFFITLSPVIWKENIYKERKGYNNETMTLSSHSKGFISIEIARFFVGILYALLITYVDLIDKTPSAFFKSVVWIIAINLIVDSLIYDGDREKVQKLTVSLGIVILLSWISVCFIYPNTNVKVFYNMLKVKEVTGSMQRVDEKHIAIVPIETAEYKGRNLIGELDNPEYYIVGKYSKQKINNQLYWVAPIEFKGLIKANNAEFSPGYIKVSAENENEVATIVSDYKMKYIPSAFFGNDLERIVRDKYPEIIIMEASFEPDETGKPFYAVTYGSYERFRKGKVVEGIIKFDPENANMEIQSISELSGFVDQIVPMDVAEKYFDYYGFYKDGGFWNSIFGQKGVKVPTDWEGGEKVVGVYVNGDMKWFTDYTTPNDEDTSMVGYGLIDARTGELTFYTEAKGYLNGKAALDKVNGSFVEKWHGTQPVLYNIFGHDTWVIPVVDEEGSLRQIALVHAKSGKLVRNENKEKVFEDYKQMLTNDLNDTSIIPTSVANSKSIEGIVERFSIETASNRTQIKILLQGHDKIFVVDTNSYPYSSFIKEGDSLSIKYVDNEQVIVSVTEIINKTLNR